MNNTLEHNGTELLFATVDVLTIHSYARNPRRQENPEYDRIKFSIQTDGLDQPLILSQPSDTSEYVLHSGGNTRLTILKELLAETGEERFRWVECIIKPWSNESTVLFSHLRENELRGGLPFIDKALAVFDAKSLLEAEMNVENLSLRQLETLFRERGLGLSHSMMSKMGYAVNTLWPVMPKALAAGLGRPQVEKIRTLERATETIWLRRHLGEKAEFDLVFAELCRRHDGVDWDIQPLRDALEHELAVASEQNRRVIYLELEAQLAGRPFEVPPPSIEHEAMFADDADDTRAPVTSHASKPASPECRDMKSATNTNREHDGDDMTSREAPPTAPELLTLPKDPLLQVEALRRELWRCAETLAADYGLGEVVIPLSDQGLGFLLIDVPAAELTETLDPDMLCLLSAVWWQLAASSELTQAPVECVLMHVHEESALFQALAEHDAGLLFRSVWTPDPGRLSGQLWQQLNPSAWQHWLRLMEAYRTLKRVATEAGIALWGNDEEQRDAV